MKNKTKQKAKILPGTTNEKAAKNKQTKFSHYLEVGQHSGFYWVLKKLSLQIKRNANLKRNLTFFQVFSSFFFQTSGSFKRQYTKKLTPRKLKLFIP